jgi:hypothetical protein
MIAVTATVFWPSGSGHKTLVLFPVRSVPRKFRTFGIRTFLWRALCHKLVDSHWFLPHVFE